MDPSNAEFRNNDKNSIANDQAISLGFLSPDGGKRAVFHSVRAEHASAVEKKVFVEECAMHAFDQNGLLKSDYQCSTMANASAATTSADYQYYRYRTVMDGGNWLPMFSGAEAFQTQFSAF